jgi:Rod binding domain-containing protein
MAELEKQKGEGLALDNVIAQISNNSENLTEREIGRLRDHFKAKRKELTTAAARENAVTTGQK